MVCLGLLIVLAPWTKLLANNTCQIFFFIYSWGVFFEVPLTTSWLLCFLLFSAILCDFGKCTVLSNSYAFILHICSSIKWKVGKSMLVMFVLSLTWVSEKQVFGEDFEIQNRFRSGLKSNSEFGLGCGIGYGMGYFSLSLDLGVNEYSTIGSKGFCQNASAMCLPGCSMLRFLGNHKMSSLYLEIDQMFYWKWILFNNLIVIKKELLWGV